MKYVARGLLLLAGLAGGSFAQLADFEVRRGSAYASLKLGLEEYADWCADKRLFVERKRAYELLLELDPEHPAALKGLGFVKDKKTGLWGPPKTPKVFHDYDEEALREAPQRLQEIRSGFVTSMTALLEAPELSAEQRSLVTSEILRYDPDNAAVHRELGEVKLEDRWVIPETARAEARRAELREIVRAGLENAPRAESCALLQRERGFDLPLRAVATPKVRVLGTGSDEELLMTAQALHGLEHVLRSVFQIDVELPPGCTIFMLADPKERDPFLKNHPAVDAERRAFLQSLDGSGIEGTTDFAFWKGDVQRRIDGIVRMVMGYLLSGAFGITVEHGWAYEGVGLYLTRALVRTRLVWFAQPARNLDHEKDFALRKRLIDPETNWIDEAHRLLQTGKAPPLAELLEKGVNDLSTEDLLFAYLLGTYVLEAQPEKATAILVSTGMGKPSARAFEGAVGMDLEQFEPHLARWLSERR